MVGKLVIFQFKLDNVWFLSGFLLVLNTTGCTGFIKNPFPLTQDSELDYDAQQFAESKNYPFEQHRVETDDHYILTMHRIKHGRNDSGEKGNGSKPVVFLQHGLLASSDDWVINSENQSLAFILADAGFDVWMGNVRGNKYSRMHSKINPTNPQYWDFTFHEMALYDIPAMLDYISGKTGKTGIYYCGHSQGTLVAFLAFSQKLDWAKQRVKQLHALAPIAYLKSTSSLIKFVAPISRLIGSTMKLFGLHEFSPSSALVQSLADRSCSGGLPRAFCTQLIFMLAGFDEKNINQTRLPVYIAHSPAGTSTKNVMHFGQMIYSKRLQYFDYGFTGNLRTYGKFSPTLYSLEKFSVPTALYWGDSDILATPRDVAFLQTEIAASVFASHKIKSTDHLDFTWGLNVAEDVYSLVLNHIRNDLNQGQVTEGQVTDGHVSQGQVTDGHVSQGQVTDGHVSQGQVTQGPETQEPEAEVELA